MRLALIADTEGIALGKSPDLTGGGLIRSAGGWAALKILR